jgi:hypothetical protein
MATIFTIDLTINLPESGRHARQMLYMYLAEMTADISEAAVKLRESNATGPAQQFAELNMKRGDVWISTEGSLKLFARFSVNSEDPDFVKKVFAEYMAGFPDCLRKEAGRYSTQTGVQTDYAFSPTDWTAEVLKT